MAQTIKLKRSATQGAIPSTSDLALGEVAINTYDGQMYIKKSVGGVESIVPVGGSGSVSYLEAGMTEYEYTATSSQTTFSGSDNNSVTLSYTANSIMVFLNGVLQDDGVDYTATNGTSVVFTSALTANDEVRIVAIDTVASTSTLQNPTKLDAITTVNAQAAYSLTVNSSAYTPSSETALIVSLNGITQEPGDSFTISGSTITFSPALVTGDVVDYIVDMGRAVTIGQYDSDLVVSGELEVTGDIIGDLRGATLFKGQAGEALSKGDVVYISGISGNTTVVSKADADDAAKMPAFGVVAADASINTSVSIYTFGRLSGLDTSSYSEGDELYVSTTAGVLTNSPPTGESSKLQKIAKVTRSDNSAGSIFIMGAGRSNAVPNLDDGDIFIGNASNQAVSASLNTKIEDYLDAGTSTPTFSSANITNTSTGDSLLITTTEDSSSAAPVITLKRNSSSPADADYLGQLKFKGENDADQEVVYAKVTAKIDDASDTTEDGLLEFALRKAGSNNIGMRLTSTDLKLINGTGLEVAGDATITGSLTVNGTTTTIDTTNLNVEDKNITLNYSTGDSSATADGAGITIQDAVNSTTDATILWNTTDDKFEFSHAVDVTGALTTGSTLTASSTITAPTLRLTDQTDVSLSSTGQALQIGPTSGINIAMDGNEIAARNNGSASTLYLNYDGGAVYINTAEVNGTKIGQWNTAYGWGDHSTQNYAVTTGDTFTGELALANNVKVRFDNTNDSNYDVTLGSYYDYDAFFQVKDGGGVTRFSVGRDSHAYVGGAGTAGNKLWDEGDFTSTSISNWNTAYGWGNHASAGYAPTAAPDFTGEVYTDSNQDAWAFRATTGTTSNSSGLWFTGTTARLLLRDSSGNIKTMLAANGTNAENVINNNTIWHAGNDGSGSGLDADTLDGVQGSSYLRSDANDTTTGKLLISVASNATDLLRVASTTSYGYMQVAGINGADAGLIFQEGTSNRCMVGHDQSADSFRIYWYNDTNGNVINNNRLTLTSSGNLNVTGNITGTTGLVSGQTSARYPIKVYSNQWPEVQFFRGSAEELRIGAAEASGSYNSAAGDFYVFDVGTGKMNLLVPSNGGSFKRNNGAYTVWDSGNDGSGSGLDADTLDGVQASGFLRTNGSNTGTYIDLYRDVNSGLGAYIDFREGSAQDIRLGVNVFDNELPQAGTALVLDRINSGGGDAHLVVHGEIFAAHGGTPSNGNKVWHAGNDGSGSGLDADTLDGSHASSFMLSSGIPNNTDVYINARVIRNNNTSTYNDGMYIGYASSNSGPTRIYGGGSSTTHLYISGTSLTFNGSNVWHAGNDGSGSGLDADTLDGYHSTSFRTVGGGLSAASGTWYTIAYNAGNRASARFHIRDTLSSRHQSVHFYASHMYGNGNAINVVHSNVFSTSPIRYIRIKEGGTYDGALLQVYFDSTSTFQAFMYENDQSSGWVLLGTPVPDGTSTGISVGNFAALTNTGAQVDIDKSVRGGFIGTGSLYVGGNITAYSDRRVKSDLQVIPDALNKVKSLNGYTFDRTDQFKDDGRQTGLVAQEVLEVLPEAVIGDEDGGYALAYGNMVGLLIEAIKEQQAQIEELKEKIKCQ